MTNTMKKILVTAALLVGTTSGTGCLASRTIGGMAQAPDKDVTLVQTQDVYALLYLYPVKTVHQFWKCSEAPGTMTCKKVCDTKNSDLVCPTATLGASNVATIQQGEGQ